jgi:hypothetical protein
MATGKAPHNAGDAAKAYRLRKAISRGETLKPIDRLWLDEYAHEHPQSPSASSSTPTGRSRSGRKVSATFDMEEAAEAEGTGEGPASIAAAAALQSREEGRRLDSLTVSAVGALEKAVETYRQICESLQAMLETYQTHHLDTLASVRDHYLARTAADSEVARLQKEAGGEDPVTSLMVMMAAKHLGIDPSLMPGVAEAAARMAAEAAASNGAAPNGAPRKQPGSTAR